MKNPDIKNADQLIHSFNDTEGSQGHFYGLTKREEFARSAMQGMLANPTLNYGDDFQTITFKSVRCADELLKQLES